MNVNNGRDGVDFRKTDLILCDIDGVVMLGEDAVDGAATALREIEHLGIAIVFCTNNSTMTPASFSDKLSRAGVRCTPDMVVTSAVAAARVLAHRLPAGSDVLTVGGAGLVAAIEGVGLNPVRCEQVDLADMRHLAAVTVGLDREISYLRIHVAAAAARLGLPFIATNDDAVVPRSDGLWPANGAVLAAIEKAAGRQAEVVGKPYAPIYEVALAERSFDDAVVVGDNIDTDLVGGRRLGLRTILVGSGTLPNSQSHAADVVDMTVESLAHLADIIGRRRLLDESA